MSEFQRGELRVAVADLLAYNDQCGVGPLSRQEYLEDAAEVIALIVERLRERAAVPSGGHVDDVAISCEQAARWLEHEARS